MIDDPGDLWQQDGGFVRTMVLMLGWGRGEAGRALMKPF